MTDDILIGWARRDNSSWVAVQLTRGLTADAAALLLRREVRRLDVAEVTVRRVGVHPDGHAVAPPAWMSVLLSEPRLPRPSDN
jgi:hypothetical protein